MSRRYEYGVECAQNVSETENRRADRSLRRRRLFLHAHDPRCFWCGRATTIKKSVTWATCDHWWPVAHIGEAPKGQKSHVVLACKQCNLRRGSTHPHRFVERERLRPNPTPLKEWLGKVGDAWTFVAPRYITPERAP